MTFGLTAFDLTALDLMVLDWAAPDQRVLDLAAGFAPAPTEAKMPASLRRRRRTTQGNAAAS
jgi:hypothetical protein